jgi:hypothetical protein
MAVCTLRKPSRQQLVFFRRLRNCVLCNPTLQPGRGMRCAPARRHHDTRTPTGLVGGGRFRGRRCKIRVAQNCLVLLPLLARSELRCRPSMALQNALWPPFFQCAHWHSVEQYVPRLATPRAPLGPVVAAPDVGTHHACTLARCRHHAMDAHWCSSRPTRLGTVKTP